MTMKHIFISVLICVAAFSAVSCSLEEKVYTQTDESYITDAAMSETLLMGVYKKLGVDGIYKQNLPFIFGLTTDESKPEGSSLTAHRAEGSNAFNPSSSYVQDTWKALYSAIYDANYFIELMARKVETFPEEDHVKCEYYVAEAKALRALLYFELVRWYGNVPLVLSTEESSKPADEFKQADPNEVYKQIEIDLKDAASVLPYSGETDVRANPSFRFSKGAALGLLSKVYATWAGYPLYSEGKWDLAASTAQEVIRNGNHALLTDFVQLWINSGKNFWDPTESLIELSYWSPLATSESSGRVGNINGVRGNQGCLKNNAPGHNVFCYFHPTFLASWKDYAKDKRFAVSYADYQYTTNGKEYYVSKTVNGVKNTPISFVMALEAAEKDQENWRGTYNYRLTHGKWDTEIYVPDENYNTAANVTNINWYLLRYSDVLLLCAEALNEVNQGPTAEAYNYVNIVRRRAFGLDYTVPSEDADLEEGLTYEAFQKAIRDERAWEFAGEAQRRQDLIRWGIYADAVHETYNNLSTWHSNAYKYFLGGEYTQKGKHELLPIPQREIDLCGYKQNPNWN